MGVEWSRDVIVVSDITQHAYYKPTGLFGAVVCKLVLEPVVCDKRAVILICLNATVYIVGGLALSYATTARRLPPHYADKLTAVPVHHFTSTLTEHSSRGERATPLHFLSSLAPNFSAGVVEGGQLPCSVHPKFSSVVKSSYCWKFFSEKASAAREFSPAY